MRERLVAMGRRVRGRWRGLHAALRPVRRAVSRWLPPGSYWERRRHLAYYSEVVRLARAHVPNGRRVIDVGSSDTEVLLAFDWFEHRVSLDLNVPLRRRGITSVRTDFLAYRPDVRFDLAVCLQVLEHVPDPGAFARRLLAVAPTVIVSVPYRWPAGLVETHAHDPIDETILDRWMGRPPLEARIVENGRARLVAVYRGA